MGNYEKVIENEYVKTVMKIHQSHQEEYKKQQQSNKAKDSLAQSDKIEVDDLKDKEKKVKFSVTEADKLKEKGTIFDDENMEGS